MLKADQLRELIIKPALYDLVLLSDEAVELLVFTCAVESDGGTYIKQLDGPALGIYQMEPATYNDIWQNYIAFKSSILMKLLYNFNAPKMPDENRLLWDLRFATAMTRLHYERVNELIPAPDNIPSIYDYYKAHYNTALGAADKEKCLAAYHAFIA